CESTNQIFRENRKPFLQLLISGNAQTEETKRLFFSVEIRDNMGAHFMLDECKRPPLTYFILLTDIENPVVHHNTSDVITYTYTGFEGRGLLLKKRYFLLC